MNPWAAPGSWDDWVPGQPDNLGSLPVDYEIEGILLEPIQVGGNCFVLRDLRNGVAAEGFFLSTEIQAFEAPDKFRTRNSEYVISTLQENVGNLD